MREKFRNEASLERIGQVSEGRVNKDGRKWVAFVKCSEVQTKRHSGGKGRRLKKRGKVVCRSRG